jgi:zinc transporter ZupT
MKTPIKHALLAAAFTTALGAVTISRHGQEWRHVLHYALDFLSGFAGMAAIVAAFVGVLGAACLGMQWLNGKLLGEDA